MLSPRDERRLLKIAFAALRVRAETTLVSVDGQMQYVGNTNQMGERLNALCQAVGDAHELVDILLRETGSDVAVLTKEADDAN